MPAFAVGTFALIKKSCYLFQRMVCLLFCNFHKHFKGKEEILDALIEKAENYYEINFGSADNPRKTPSSMKELINLSLKRIQFTLHDPMIKKSEECLLWSSSATNVSLCSPKNIILTAYRNSALSYSSACNHRVLQSVTQNRKCGWFSQSAFVSVESQFLYRQ